MARLLFNVLRSFCPTEVLACLRARGSWGCCDTKSVQNVAATFCTGTKCRNDFLSGTNCRYDNLTRKNYRRDILAGAKCRDDILSRYKIVPFWCYYNPKSLLLVARGFLSSGECTLVVAISLFSKFDCDQSRKESDHRLRLGF